MRLVSQFEFCERYSPPRIGAVAAHQENIAKPPLKAQTGWSVPNDHPVRAYQRMPSAILFDGTATPPILRKGIPLANLKLRHHRLRFFFENRNAPVRLASRYSKTKISKDP